MNGEIVEGSYGDDVRLSTFDPVMLIGRMMAHTKNVTSRKTSNAKRRVFRYMSASVPALSNTARSVRERTALGQ